MTATSTPWLDGAAAERIEQVEQAIAGVGTADVAPFVESLLERHAEYYDKGLVLYAGTNAISDAERRLHDVQLSSRPSMGWPGAKYQTGLDQVEVLEVLTARCVAQAMRARFAEVRLHSATLANLAVFTAFAEPGDTVAVLSEHCGGHTSHQVQGVAGVRGLRIKHLPYDCAAWDVDIQRLPGWLAEHQPRILVVGASLLLFPHRLSSIADAAAGTGTVVVYDASHMAGLIAGGRFQDPLAEGADVMTFSTYKSFGGPAGGAIVTNDPGHAERLSTAAYPGLTANYDAGRLAPLAVRAARHVQEGSTYADACIANAQALAQALAESGLNVAAAERGFTVSHHVAVDVRTMPGSAVAATDRLAGARIYSSAIGLPDQLPEEPPAAVRLGTQEVTSRGLGPADMKDIAARLADVLLPG